MRLSFISVYQICSPSSTALSSSSPYCSTSPPRLFHPSPPPLSPDLVLPLLPSHISHLQALRLQPPTPLTLLTPHNLVDTLLLPSLDIQVLGIRSLPPPPPLSLIISLPRRPPRVSFLIEKLAELGLPTLHFCRSARTQPSRVDQSRWSRIAAAAAEQSLAERLMNIDMIDSWHQTEAFVEDVVKEGGKVWLLDQAGIGLKTIWEEEGKEAWVGKGICFVVGPEGGFTDEEKQRMMAYGASLVCLGKGRLRVETAAVAAVAAVRVLAED